MDIQSAARLLAACLENPASGHYAQLQMRAALIELLQDWPSLRYKVADMLLPHGRPISERSRKALRGMPEVIATARLIGGPAPTSHDLKRLYRIAQMLAI